MRRDLGDVALKNLTREQLIGFGKARAREGAGPVTVGMDIGYIRTILVHATAIHGITTPTETVMLARVADYADLLLTMRQKTTLAFCDFISLGDIYFGHFKVCGSFAMGSSEHRRIMARKRSYLIDA